MKDPGSTWCAFRALPGAAIRYAEAPPQAESLRPDPARRPACSLRAIRRSRDGAPSAHRDLCAQRRNQQRVAVFQPLEVRTHTVQQQFVGVDFFNQFLAAIVFQFAQRAPLVMPPAANSALSGVESELMS